MHSLPTERRIRLAALFIAVGMVIEGISLLWIAPSSFFLFLILGAGLSGIGIVMYLFSFLLRIKVKKQQSS